MKTVEVASVAGFWDISVLTYGFNCFADCQEPGNTRGIMRGSVVRLGVMSSWDGM